MSVIVAAQVMARGETVREDFLEISLSEFIRGQVESGAYISVYCSVADGLVCRVMHKSIAASHAPRYKVHDSEGTLVIRIERPDIVGLDEVRL